MGEARCTILYLVLLPFRNSYLHSQQGVWNEEQHGPPMQTEDGACCFPALFEIEDIKMEGWLAEGLGLIQKLQHSQSERDAGVML